jgi:hypothetical protein
MKPKLLGSLLLGAVLSLSFAISARPDGDRDRGPDGDRDRDHHSDWDGKWRDDVCRDSDHLEESRNAPVGLVGVIQIPGNPITSADITWADPGTERLYFADRSNSGVDIVDAEDDVFVGRVPGFAGPLTSGGGTSTTNGPGPNGVVVTPDRKLWAGDGNSLAGVADVDPNSANYLKLLTEVSTAIAACDDGVHHYCGRADELDYDPVHKVILIANNAPLALAAPHGAIDPYATFIDAKSFTVLGHVSFPGAGGLEQPKWDREKQRFLITVPGALNAGGTAVTLEPSIQVINPVSMKSEATYSIDCSAVAGTLSASITGLAIGPFQHILVSACGYPIVLTLNHSTHTIHVINVAKQVGGGDEVWFNPGDDRFYVTGRLNNDTTQSQQLGVIDAETGLLLQNVPQQGPLALSTRGKNPAAFPENNHIFDIQQISSSTTAATDDSVCAKVGFKATGCIAIFEHKE